MGPEDRCFEEEVKALGRDRPGVVALTYYDPPRVFGNASEPSSVYCSPYVKNNSPYLRMWIEEDGLSSTKSRDTIIELNECEKIE